MRRWAKGDHVVEFDGQRVVSLTPEAFCRLLRDAGFRPVVAPRPEAPPPAHRYVRHDRLLLAAVAELVARAEARGESPRTAVADAYNRHPRTAARWIAEARKAGLLEEETPGPDTESETNNQIGARS